MAGRFFKSDEVAAGFFSANGRVWVALFLASLVFLAACLFHTINVPWVEEDNYCGAFHSQAARNNLRAGLRVTGGVPATFHFGPLPIPRDTYYVHHPTLMPLMVTASVAIFGESEWAAKLVPIFCSLVSAALLWLLVCDAVDRRAAALVAGFFVTLPMELHYGDMVDFAPSLVMWMLATLLCLRYWEVRGGKRWAVLAVVCCLGAVWTDWPGYLFAIAISVSFLLRKRKQTSWFALALLVGVLFSGLLFLLQIHHVNPEAWRDLWQAVTMRLGSGVQPGSSGNAAAGAAHFGFGEWLQKILQALGEDYLLVTWVFVLTGAIHLLRNLKRPGLRWLGWAVLQMASAGIPYMLLLRNWSFIHDWASFFEIGCIAILGGLGILSIVNALDRRFPALSSIAALGLFVWLAAAGFMRAESQRSQLLMLDGQTAEPAYLIRDVGRYLTKTFPPDTTILCNFDPYYSTLPYYAQRTILNNLDTRSGWESASADSKRRIGGIVWLGAPSSAEILAALPAKEIARVEIDGVSFAVWKPGR